MSDRGTGARDAVGEALLLDAIRDEVRGHAASRALLIGMQVSATVSAVNALMGAERVVLLHLDRAAGGAGLGLGNRELFLGATLDPDAVFSVVALNVEAAKSYRLLRDVVGQTARAVGEDGVVLVAGPKKGGADVAARTLREQFASVELLAYRKGRRVFRARRPRPMVAADPVQDADARAEEIATHALRGHEIRLIQDDRVFARGRLDAATRMLAEVFEIPPGARVLDLGSGSGILGILAVMVEPSSRSFLVDSDPLAIDVSRRNAVLNGVENISTKLSDVLQALPGQIFDVVLMNPPFHRGRRQDTTIAERFLTEASQAIRPGGHLYVVCNRFLRYEPVVDRLIGPVREVTGDAHFKVLLAERRLS